MLPFHAAEQRSKKQKNDSAEHSDIPRRLLFASSTGQFRIAESSDWLSFWFVFGQAKMNRKKHFELLIGLRTAASHLSAKYN